MIVLVMLTALVQVLPLKVGASSQPFPSIARFCQGFVIAFDDSIVPYIHFIPTCRLPNERTSQGCLFHFYFFSLPAKCVNHAYFQHMQLYYYCCNIFKCHHVRCVFTLQQSHIAKSSLQHLLDLKYAISAHLEAQTKHYVYEYFPQQKRARRHVFLHLSHLLRRKTFKNRNN